MSPTHEDEDAALMLAFQAGDSGAFTQLFGRYSGPLLSFLARMVGSRSRAEELTQDTFVRIYQARERYEPRARFSTYAFGIAHNLALNDLARAHHKRERPLGDDFGEAFASPEPTPEAAALSSATQENLEHALRQLPDRQRAALLLRVEHDLSYDEIARALETTTSSVKSLIHRARSTLLGELGEIEEP